MARPGGNPNLKPDPKHQFRKGVSGNPGGKTKLQIEIENKLRITKVELKDILLKCLEMTKEEIVTFLSRPDATMFEVTFGGLVVKAAQKDQFAITFIADRLFGKPKDVYNITENKTVVYQTSVSDNGTISCDAIDVEADTQTAFKTLETYSENNTAETTQRNTTGNL